MDVPGSGRQDEPSALIGMLIGVCGILLLICGVLWLRHDCPSAAIAMLSPVGGEALTAIVFVLIGLVVVIWWLVSFLAALLSEVFSRRGHAAAAERMGRLSPAFMRPLAVALLGAQIMVAPAAQAAGAPAPVNSTAFTTTVPDLEVPVTGTIVPSASWNERNLPSPRWKAKRAAAPLDRLMGRQRDGSAPEDSVVVEAGDSLWLIAARMAGPKASDAEIARAWPRWYQANREAIGPDPDLLHIGTILTRPPAESGQNGK